MGARCNKCGKVLKDVEHYRKGYQGYDWTEVGPEDHDVPNDCIRYLAAELARMLGKD